MKVIFYLTHLPNKKAPRETNPTVVAFSFLHSKNWKKKKNQCGSMSLNCVPLNTPEQGLRKNREGKAMWSSSKLDTVNRWESSLETLVKPTGCLLFGLSSMSEAFSTAQPRGRTSATHTLETDSSHGLPGNVVTERRLQYRGIRKIKMHLLTVLKFGKSPTAELLSTGKDMNGLMSSEGCIIRVGVRTRAGRVVVWHALPAKNTTKQNKFSLSLTSISLPSTQGQRKAAELWPSKHKSHRGKHLVNIVKESSLWTETHAEYFPVHKPRASQGQVTHRSRFHQQVWRQVNVPASNPPGIFETPQTAGE